MPGCSPIKKNAHSHLLVGQELVMICAADTVMQGDVLLYAAYTFSDQFCIYTYD